MKKFVLSLTFTLAVFISSLIAADQSSGADYPLGLFYFDFACSAEEVAKTVVERDTLALS